MNKAKMLCLLLVIVFVPTIFAGEISPYLADYLNGLATSDNVSVMVMLSDQADIATLNEQLKTEHATLAERNRRVIEALQEVASNTQPAVSAYLDNLKAAGEISEYRMMWIANMVLVNSTKAGIYSMAENASVGTIYYDYEIEEIEPVNVNLNDDPPLIASHETGADLINAPAAWAAGFTGAGRVVANMDTGVDGDHEALADRFRGDVDGDGDVDESWYDPYAGWTYPQDSAEHGTHTMGTICGRSDDGDTVGIAIDAQWIAAAPIDRGGGIEGTMEDAVLSFEWFADPDADPTTQDNPDAVGNSWGISPIYHGVDECDETFWVVIDNLEAAGTAVVFSAGNEGPDSQTLRTPGNRATTQYNCFSVGSVGSSQGISDFSSRGPSVCTPDGEETFKPEVVAYGENVRSSLPGGSYGTMSGTSMASPHITGSIGVIRSVNPDLDVDSIKEILMATAIDLGDDGEDNDYGRGIIDLYEACLVAQSGYGYAEGYVYDINNNIIADAKVSVDGSTRLTYADESGFYHIGLPASDTAYTLTASYFGYVSSSADVTIEADQTTTQNFNLAIADMGTLYGYVRDNNSNPIEGAEINIADTPLDSVLTNSEGYYIMTNIPGGASYTVEASATSYGFGSADDVYIEVGGSTQQDFSLQSLESFETDDAGWEADGGWEWGEPTSGPGEAYDGNYVWGYSLTGEYDSNVDYSLVTGTYAINEATASLTFYHWYELESSWDGGNVRISTDGGSTWTLINPDGDYPEDDLSGLDDESGYSGSSSEWVLATFDLSEYQGENVMFKFRFGTDGSVTYSGWYIDGVVVNGGTPWDDTNPNISVTPTSLHSYLDLDETEDASLTIGNFGEGSLTYTATVSLTGVAVNASENSNSSSLDLSQYTEKYKENGISHYIFTGSKELFDNTASGNGTITATGGPDAFGYTWIDSDETNGPTYNWIDITSNGTLIDGLGDDENVGTYDIGFTFPFYGQDFTTFRICSNGFISFTCTDYFVNGQTLPTGTEPYNLIAPFWNDLDPSNDYGSGDVYYYSNNVDTLIVSYVGVPHYDYTVTNTFQVIITTDGNIVFQYAEVNEPLDSYSAGIQNGDATIGLQVAFGDSTYLHNDLAVKIAYPSGWLSVSPTGGTVESGESTELTVTFNSADLVDESVYPGIIYIASNDPDSPTIAVPCTLYVGIIVGIEDEGEATLPSTFTLDQNYPNPFNPTTEISFGLPTSGMVNLAIYDVMGRKVATLANEVMAAGTHTIIWNGSNNSGEKVTSGVYFYKLTAGNDTITKKMIMLK